MVTLTISRFGALSRSSRICSLVSQNGRLKSGKPSLFSSSVQESSQIGVSSWSPPTCEEPALERTLIPISRSLSGAWESISIMATSCNVVYAGMIGSITVPASVPIAVL